MAGPRGDSLTPPEQLWCPDRTMTWTGPLSISIGFNDGDYCNTELSKGTTDEECIDALQRCDEILAMEDPGEDGMSIGWHDLSNDKGDSVRYPSIMSTKEEFAGIVNDLRNFMSS